MGAFYCSVCRKTDFSGKGHIYGKSHQSKLKVILVKFTEKVKEARRTIKNPQVEKYSPHHEEKFWCYCCALEVQKHVTDSNISVLYGGLLEHMRTPEHRKNTHKFWWDNKAEPKLRDKFIITEEETERFKSEVSKALEQFEEKEDVLIKQQAAVIRSQEQHRLEVLQSLSEPDPELVQPAEVDQHSSKHAARSSHSRSYEAEAQPGPSHEDFASHSQWNEPELGLTFIGYQDSTSSGNVHTGAVPPWLLEEPDEASSSGQQEMGPSLQEFLKHKEQEKLKKLPPNRVGANFDHGSHTDANWLPSFGRVWNSGRRWQSRHQFREEEAKTRGKRKREDDGKATKKQKDLSNGEL
ncbi:coiled-coil domain-containing protein 84-like isoform X1 [Sinocyclocheilus anshuiensis]|uniref:coiled-coil domain-containing protein 84-like isoform X1 n=1 Tax=Sinocyclocheilus anshuiensis TaxID=1608454 RepID=UPI0007B8AE5E|nr:PREDICTED: coiled-coil domain-containing protein 84-like isoform X1 [Sinocyclocheilus anshuiensis]XP_016310307.1 PREDICTED: coiled-coil domain-containing protein 84-like isoform X1 [Sinocyclocheilus anshuiensis]